MTHSELVKQRISDAIKQYMAANDISQDMLAARLGIHQTAISAYRQGRMIPRADTLLRMAGTLDMDLNKMIPTENELESSTVPVPA